MQTEIERNRAIDNLRLAEQLGAETATLTGRNVAEEVLRFAGPKHITRIIAGKPGRSPLKNIFLNSPVDRLVRLSGEIDVEVASGDAGGAAPAPYRVPAEEFPWSDYGTGLLFLMLATGLCFLMYPRFDLSNLIMIYLLAVMLTAIESGRGPAILVSGLSVLAFDFFFVPQVFIHGGRGSIYRDFHRHVCGGPSNKPHDIAHAQADQGGSSAGETGGGHAWPEQATRRLPDR